MVGQLTDPGQQEGQLTIADFTLIWDQRFVQPLKPYEAMNYTAPPPLRVARVTQTDLNEVRSVPLFHSQRIS